METGTDVGTARVGKRRIGKVSERSRGTEKKKKKKKKVGEGLGGGTAENYFLTSSTHYILFRTATTANFRNINKLIHQQQKGKKKKNKKKKERERKKKEKKRNKEKKKREEINKFN